MEKLEWTFLANSIVSFSVFLQNITVCVYSVPFLFVWSNDISLRSFPSTLQFNLAITLLVNTYCFQISAILKNESAAVEIHEQASLYSFLI